MGTSSFYFVRLLKTLVLVYCVPNLTVMMIKMKHFSWYRMRRKLYCQTGGKFAVAGQQIAGASENFVLNY